MSMWASANEDAKSVSPDQITTGRRLGFLEAIEAGYDESVRYSSSYGAERALQEEEAENIRRIRQAGGAAPEELDTFTFLSGQDTGPYSDFIYGTPGQRSSVDTKARDEQLRKLQEQYPDAGIRTYSEMFDTVKSKSDAARKQAARGTTLGGSIGGFLGSAAGGLDPRVNPLNTLAAGAGGFGRSAFGRIATEAGVGGVSEALNQVTGVQANQRVLGGNPTLGDAALSVGGAVVAGGLLQGLGEGVAAGARRWFRSTPTDPAPIAPEPAQRVSADPATIAQGTAPRAPAPIPEDTARLIRDTVAASIPGASTRGGRRAAAVDLDYVTGRLDTWTPDARPWELAPPTSTALPGRADLTPAFDPVRAPVQSLDDAARAVDPQTFAVYDKLAARAQALRAEIGDTKAVQTEAAQSGAAQEVREQIDQLRSRLASAKAKQKSRIQSEIDELEASYAQQFGNVDTTVPADTGGAVAAKRQQLQELDYKMRDMAPTVSRAYARARNEWVPPEELDAVVRAMTERADTKLAPGDTFVLPERMPENATNSYAAVPELQAPGVVASVGKAADAVRQVQLKRQEISDAASEVFRASVARTLAGDGVENAAPGTLSVEVNGRRIELDDALELDVPLDFDDVSQGFRQVSARQLLEDIDADNQIMQAVTTCQIR